MTLAILLALSAFTAAFGAEAASADTNATAQGASQTDAGVKAGNDSSAKEKELFEAIERWAESHESDPNSPTTKQLGLEVDKAMEKVNVDLSTDPRANLRKLPAGVAPKRSAVPPRQRANVQRLPVVNPATKVNLVGPEPPQRAISPEVAPEAAREAMTVEAVPGVAIVPDVPAISAIAGVASAAEMAETFLVHTDENKEGPVSTQNGTEQPEMSPKSEPKPEPEATPEPELKPEPEPKPEESTPAAVEHDPNYITIKTQDDIIDINVLLETVGKELKLNFMYDDGVIPAGRVKLQQYGKIHRNQLLPLLESVLGFSTPPCSMVREGPYIRIVKRSDVLRNTELFSPSVKSETTPESVVVEIVELRHKSYNEVQKVLAQFVPDPTAITTIENTNYLIITDYASRMGRLLEIIELVDSPGPSRRLEIITPKYITAEEASKKVDELLKALDQGMATETTGAAPAPPAPGPQPPTPPRRGRVTRPRGTPAAPSDVSGSSGGPDVIVDERTGRLMVIGTDEEIEKFIHILGLLDVAQPGPEITIKAIHLKLADAGDTLSQLTDLIKALNNPEQDTPAAAAADKAAPAPPRPPSRRQSLRKTPIAGALVPQGPYMLADERTNRIFVVGIDEDIAQVTDLIELLDVEEPGEKIRIEFCVLKHLNVESAAEQLSELIQALNGEETTGRSSGRTPTPAPAPPSKETGSGGQNKSSFIKTGEKGPYLVADIRTNNLLVIGNNEQISQVYYLLRLLDVDINRELSTLSVEHVRLSEILSPLTDLLVVLNEQDEAVTSGQGTSRQAAPPAGADAGAASRNRSRRGRSSQSESSGMIEIVPQGPYLLANERTNQLLVIGRTDQIKQVEELMKLLDVDLKLKLIPIEIQHILSTELASQLSDLLTALTDQEGPDDNAGNQRPRQQPSARRGGRDRMGRASEQGVAELISIGAHGPYLLPDERTNRLIFVGTDEQFKAVTDLLPVLDVPASEYGLMQLRIYQPHYVEAKEVEQILKDLGITETSSQEKMRPRERAAAAQRPAGTTEGAQAAAAEGMLIPGMEEPEIRIAIQESTNRIFVYAMEYQLHDIEQIMSNIDIDPNDAFGQYQIVRLENQTPEFVAQSLGDIMESDKKDAKSGAVVPGAEGAPTIVALEDIYSIGIRGSSRQRQEITQLIESLDRRMPQVLIEAILVQVSIDDSLKLGVTLQNAYDVGGTNTGTRGVSGISPFSVGTIAKSGKVVTGSGGTIAFFNDDFVYAALEALQTEGNARVMSRPRVLVNNNAEAFIDSSRKKPTTKTTLHGSSGTPITEFDQYVEAGTKLSITPHISEGREGRPDFLKLEINLVVSSFEGEGSESIPPPQANNEIDTDITIPDDSTIILGGLTRTTDSINISKIPLLGDIPLLGMLFRSVNRIEETSVLYVFVKARVVNEPLFGDLKGISKTDDASLRQMEANYRQQSIIPGFPEKSRSLKNSALDSYEVVPQKDADIKDEE